MEKIYSKHSKPNSQKLPSKQTKDFILSYSKSLKIIDCGSIKIEMLIN